MRELTFYFDYISPYAYLAWTQIHALAKRHAVTVRAEPILFAALLNHHGQKGPAEIPAKRAYIARDIARNAAHVGVPIGVPASHPFNPLLPLRASRIAMSHDTRRALIDAIFAEVWGGGGGEVSDPQVISGIAASLGIEGVLERALAPDNKASLKLATEEAIARGTFGVPTLIVDETLFWGFDSLPHLDRFLAGSEPDWSSFTEAWSGLKPSASR